MPKKDLSTDDFIISETGNWNVAAEYSRLKIMNPLNMADEYANIAFFGASSIIDELVNSGLNISIDEIRLTGLKRLIRTLITLIENTIFAIKYPEDIKQLESYKQTLIKLESKIPLLVEVRVNDVKKTRQISLTDKYTKVLYGVLKIKADINIPLNKSHLIFTDKNEFDPKAFKTAIKERIISKG